MGFKGRQVQVQGGNKKGDASDTSTAATRATRPSRTCISALPCGNAANEREVC